MFFLISYINGMWNGTKIFYVVVGSVAINMVDCLIRHFPIVESPHKAVCVMGCSSYFDTDISIGGRNTEGFFPSESGIPHCAMWPFFPKESASFKVKLDDFVDFCEGKFSHRGLRERFEVRARSGVQNLTRSPYLSQRRIQKKMNLMTEKGICL